MSNEATERVFSPLRRRDKLADEIENVKETKRRSQENLKKQDEPVVKPL